MVAKREKNVFYIHTNIVTKNGRGKKRAKQFFQKHTNGAIKKCWEKTIANMYEKTFFLYSHKYRDQKIGEKTRETIFPETHQ